MATADGSAERTASTMRDQPAEPTRRDLPVITDEIAANGGRAVRLDPLDPMAGLSPLEEIDRLLDNRAREPVAADSSTGGSVVDPTLPDPALSDPALSDPALPDPTLPDSAVIGGTVIGRAPHLLALSALRTGAVVGDPVQLRRLFTDPAALPVTPPHDTSDDQAATHATQTGVTETSSRETSGPKKDDTETGPTETGPPAGEPRGPTDETTGGAPHRPHARLLEIPPGLDRAYARAAVVELIGRFHGKGRRTLLLTPDEQSLDELLDDLGPEPEPLTVRVEPDPAGPAPVTAKVIGTARPAAWADRLRRLRRGLLWLELWPADRASLQAAKNGHLTLEERFADEIAGLAGEIDKRQAVIPAAEEGAEQAGREVERLADDHRRLAEESAALSSDRDRLLALASNAEEAAAGAGRSAREARERCAELDGRIADLRAHLEAARQAEASLTEDLARARDALPAAAAEIERLAEVSAAADAAWHAAYYRLAAAESTLAAHRRRLSWGQRVSMVSARQQLKEHRHRVSTRTREADQAAARARQIKHEHDAAEARHAELISFISTGLRDLAEAQATQERLAPEIAGLEIESVSAHADHEVLAKEAAEAAERAETASSVADQAAKVAGRAEQLLSEAATTLRDAEHAEAEARAVAESAMLGLAEAREALRAKRAESEAALAASRAEVESATEIEAVSRRHVAELCGTDPDTMPDDEPAAHQDRVMAEVARLDALLGAHDSGATVLGEAQLICATPAMFGAHPAAADLHADALIAYDAGRLTDDEIIIGAVRTHRWVLVGDRSSTPATDPAGLDHLRALTLLHLAEERGPEAGPGAGPEPDDGRRLEGSAPTGTGGGGDAASSPDRGVAPTRALPVLDLPDVADPPGDPAEPPGGEAALPPGGQGGTGTLPLPMVWPPEAGSGEAGADATDSADGQDIQEPTGRTEADAGAADSVETAPSAENLARAAGDRVDEAVNQALDLLRPIIAVDAGAPAAAGSDRPGDQAAAAATEARRIRSAGLWERHYRAAYLGAFERVRRMLGEDGDGDELTALGFQGLLDATFAERLQTGPFQRIATAAPALCRPLPERSIRPESASAPEDSPEPEVEVEVEPQAEIGQEPEPEPETGNDQGPDMEAEPRAETGQEPTPEGGTGHAEPDEIDLPDEGDLEAGGDSRRDPSETEHTR